MPRTLRSGRVVNSDPPAINVGAAVARGQAPPAVFTTWQAYHLAEGLKIAVDYLNLPVPPAGQRYRNGVHHSNRKAAVTHSRRARHWARDWYRVSRNTTWDASLTPGTTPPHAIELASANFPTAGLVAAQTAEITPLYNMNVQYPAVWTLSSAAGATILGRVQAVAPAAVGGITRATYDNFMRVAARNGLGLPRSWNMGFGQAEQAAIAAVDGAYVPAGGNPKVVAYANLSAPPLGGVPSAFLEKMPEFLCQLGAKKRQADFL